MQTDVIARKYRIVREIARSNDIVYEAVDITMGRRLAIKELVVPPNLTGTGRTERIERFNREARAAGKLSHPNIVTVYDFGEEAGRYFIAMEYLEGGTLRDLLQTRGALPADQAVDIGSQVLAALSHAHGHSVIHRDVKPDNIHILPDGLIKLTDFGIARLTEEASLTGDGQVFGTPSYMSPEQIEGRFVDHRSDLFSLGVVLYEMFAGRKPFVGDSVVSITYAIMNAEPAPAPSIPVGLERIVMRALSKDPGLRHQSADEMRRALREAASAPAMFLSSPAPTSMGPSPWQAPPAAAPGASTPRSSWRTGFTIPAPAPTPPVYAPPPGAAPGPSASGPFVTWAPTPAAPPAAAPPGPPTQFRPPAPPLIGPGLKALFNILFVSFVLAAIALSGVLLFVRAYDEHRSQAASLTVRNALAAANELAAQGDLAGAAETYRRIMLAARDPADMRTARTSLATTLNRLGVRAADMRQDEQAIARFAAVLDLYAHYSDYLTPADEQERQAAADNLEAVRARAGLGSSSGGAPSVGDPDAGPSAPDDALRARIGRAQAWLQAGDQAARNGDTARAREYWTMAATEAPGSQAALEAQSRLGETSASPMF